MNKLLLIFPFLFIFPVFGNFLKENGELIDKDVSAVCKEAISNYPFLQQAKESKTNLNLRVCKSEEMFAYVRMKDNMYNTLISTELLNFIVKEYAGENDKKGVCEIILDHENLHITLNHFDKWENFLEWEADLYSIKNSPDSDEAIDMDKINLLIVLLKKFEKVFPKSPGLQARISVLEQIKNIVESMQLKDGKFKVFEALLTMIRFYKNDGNINLNTMKGACRNIKTVINMQSTSNGLKINLRKTNARCLHLVFFIEHGFQNLKYHGSILYPGFTYSSEIPTKGEIKKLPQSYNDAKEAYVEAFGNKKVDKILKSSSQNKNDIFLISSYGYLLIYDKDEEIRQSAKGLVDLAFNNFSLSNKKDNNEYNFIINNRDIVHALLEKEENYVIRFFKNRINSDRENFFELSDNVSKANRVRWLIENGECDQANLEQKNITGYSPFQNQLISEVKHCK